MHYSQYSMVRLKSTVRNQQQTASYVSAFHLRPYQKFRDYRRRTSRIEHRTLLQEFPFDLLHLHNIPGFTFCWCYIKDIH